MFDQHLFIVDVCASVHGMQSTFIVFFVQHVLSFIQEKLSASAGVF